MQVVLKDQVDKLAAASKPKHLKVDEVLARANQPRKTAVILRHPKAHPLFFIGTPERD